MMATDETVPPIVELCEQFQKYPVGTVVRFDEGVDFSVRPTTFRNQLHREMRHDGYIVQSVVRSGAVYAKVKRVLGDVEPYQPEATRSEPEADPQPGPVVPSFIVPEPTNPSVPQALFMVAG
jgi:hypothetical protein